MRFFKVSGLCGGGKTQRALEFVAREIVSTQHNYVIAQPTMELMEQTQNRLKALNPNIDVKVLNSSTCGDEKVYECVKEILLKTPKNSSKVLLCSHKAIMDGLPGLSPFKRNWNLLVDEIPQIDDHYSVNIAYSKKHFPEFFQFHRDKTIKEYCPITLQPLKRYVAESWCKGRGRDDVREVMRPVLETMLKEHTQTWIDIKRHDESRRGEINLHSVVTPEVFASWKSVTVIGAHFENSLMYQVWQRMNVEWAKHPHIESDPETHDEQTSKRLKIYYFSEKPWSKSLRDRIGTAKFKPLMKAINTMIGNEETLWVANNDVKDYELNLRNSTRISNVCHGNNSYLDYKNILCFSALNDKPGHIHWFKAVFGFEPQVLKLARGYETLYQCLMRTNLRIADSHEQVRVIVPDFDQAFWLTKDVFPGAEMHYLDDWEGAEHTKAGLKATRLTRDDILHEVRSKLASSLWRNPGFSFERNIYQAIPVNTNIENWEQVRDLLHKAAQQSYTSKEDNLLISGAIFDPDADTETNKGLNNVLVCSSMWLDFDGGELSHNDLSMILSDICHISFNSFNNGTNGQLRYRCFIPLKTPVTAKQYHVLWDIINERIEKYCQKYQMESGLDRSKRTANSWFYMPCQSSQGSKFNIWFDHWHLDLILDPVKMLDGRIVMEEDSTPIYTQPVVSKELDYSAALARWQSTQAKAGEGNKRFFAFAVELAKLGFDVAQIQNILHQSAVFARHPEERRKQIPSIMKSMRKMVHYEKVKRAKGI